MTKRRSYPLTFAPIREYWTKIESGQEIVSQKIYRTYRHIVRRMDGEGLEYFYDPRRANHVIEFVENYRFLWRDSGAPPDGIRVGDGRTGHHGAEKSGAVPVRRYTMLTILQGDALSVPISIKLNGIEVTDADIQAVKVTMGGVEKRYPGEITYDSGRFLFPLTQEETLGMTPGVNEAIIRPKFSAESLRGARIKTAFSVIASPDKEVL